MNNTVYTVVVVAIGFVYLGAIYILAPAQAAGQLPAVLAFVGVTITLLQKTGATEKEVAKVAAQATDHAEALAVNTVATEKGAAAAVAALALVNGQKHAQDTKMADLERQLAAVLETLNRERGQHDVMTRPNDGAPT